MYEQAIRKARSLTIQALDTLASIDAPLPDNRLGNGRKFGEDALKAAKKAFDTSLNE